MAKKKVKQKTKKNKIVYGKKIVFMLDIEPYKQQCVVVLNGQFSDATKYIKKHGDKKYIETFMDFIKDHGGHYKDDYETGSGKLYHKLPTGYVMLLSHCNSWRTTVGVVTHESLHLTKSIMDKVGMVMCEHSEEAYTYLQENIVRKILDKIY